MYIYSHPGLETSSTALPDVEVFEIDPFDAELCPSCALNEDDSDGYPPEHGPDHYGFYWWFCLPGCLPDGDASGPFSTPAEAVADALGEADAHG